MKHIYSLCKQIKTQLCRITSNQNQNIHYRACLVLRKCQEMQTLQSYMTWIKKYFKTQQFFRDRQRQCTDITEQLGTLFYLHSLFLATWINGLLSLKDDTLSSPIKGLDGTSSERYISFVWGYIKVRTDIWRASKLTTFSESVIWSGAHGKQDSIISVKINLYINCRFNKEKTNSSHLWRKQQFRP